MSNGEIGNTLVVRRGTPDLESLKLEMTLIYEAERRLHEVRHVTPATSIELTGYFNEACNTTTKYLSWIKYEILQAQKFYDLERARVILETAPEEFKKLKDTGIKFNEDFREALIIRDTICASRLDTLNALKAVEALLENKAKSFERGYYACRDISEAKSKNSATPNFSGTVGQTYENAPANFMGERRRS